MALPACVTRGRSRTPSARVLRQLIVNVRSLSKVAFTLLASFRGLAVSLCASSERLTLYHSRVIKQTDILRVVLQSRPDLRCIECHRRRPPPLLRRNFCLMCAGFAATRPLAAVPLSHLASAVSIAHNAQFTSRFQIVGPTQNAKRPPWDAAGASDASFQGNLACFLLGYADGGINLRAGGSRPANGIVGQVAADSTCAGMRSLALIAWHLNLSPVRFYLYSERSPRHFPRPT